ncbi:MAG: hypothetical protein ISS19_17800 [Bacteroidales bacterium]|nr:hypothetical protein [Bacteroidales bacterium]
MKTKIEFLHMSVIRQMKYDEISQKLGVNRKQLSEWWEELKEERKKISEVRTLFNRKKFQKVSFPEFYDWYQNQRNQCHYCGLTQGEIDILIKDEKIKTRRLKTRGRKLELERRHPNLDYDQIDNLVLCCYWCNNSKSDEFTESEFGPIGIEIGKIWKNRLVSTKTK